MTLNKGTMLIMLMTIIITIIIKTKKTMTKMKNI